MCHALLPPWLGRRELTQWDELRLAARRRAVRAVARSRWHGREAENDGSAGAFDQLHRWFEGLTGHRLALHRAEHHARLQPLVSRGHRARQDRHDHDEAPRRRRGLVALLRRSCSCLRRLLRAAWRGVLGSSGSVVGDERDPKPALLGELKRPLHIGGWCWFECSGEQPQRLAIARVISLGSGGIVERLW